MIIDYITLFVEDIELTLGFYQEILEFDFPNPIKDGCVEGWSGTLKIGLYEKQWLTKLFGKVAKLSKGSQNFLFSMTVDNLDHVFQKLEQRSVTILQPPTIMPWGQRVCFFEDPDSNLLEIVEKFYLK